jgi:hypothetical protein
MSLPQRIFHRLNRTWNVLLTGQAERLNTRQVPPITPEEVAEARTFFPMEKFFMFGHARSGTTLLARLVGLHPDVFCLWQAHFFSRPPLLSGVLAEKRFEAWLGRRSNRWNRGTDLSPVALRAMADFILEREARTAGARVVGDKSPNVLTNGEAVREMQRIYPDGRVVYIVRDGRDTLISHRFQNFIDGSQFLPARDLAIRDDFARDPAPYFAGQKSLFTEKALRRMLNGWVENVVDTNAAARQLFPDQYHLVRYEQLIDQPWEAIAALWRFLGVDPQGQQDAVAAEMTANPDAAWQQEKAGDLVANLVKGKRGSWRDLLIERDKAIVKELAGQTLIEWGYAEDLNW